VSIPAKRINQESIAVARFPPKISALSGHAGIASVICPFREKSFFPTVLAKRCAYKLQVKRNGSTARLRGIRNSVKKIAGGGVGGVGVMGRGPAGAGICGPDWDRSVGRPRPIFVLYCARNASPCALCGRPNGATLPLCQWRAAAAPRQDSKSYVVFRVSDAVDSALSGVKAR
jgi:hypothetical protein